MYSQLDEERWILETVGHLPNGRFLDIGAHDGAYLSNTLALVERGWSGVLVEANPLTFARLVERHGANPRLRLVNGIAGRGWILRKFWAATTDTGLSTPIDSFRAARAEQAQFLEPFYVAEFPLSRLFNPESAGEYDFISIDVEGGSVDLLLAMPYAPRCVCVEHDDRLTECASWAAIHNCREIARNPINVIYAKEPQ